MNGQDDDCFVMKSHIALKIIYLCGTILFGTCAVVLLFSEETGLFLFLAAVGLFILELYFTIKEFSFKIIVNREAICQETAFSKLVVPFSEIESVELAYGGAWAAKVIKTKGGKKIRVTELFTYYDKLNNLLERRTELNISNQNNNLGAVQVRESKNLKPLGVIAIIVGAIVGLFAIDMILTAVSME